MSDQESAAATGVVKFSAGVVVNPEQRHSGKKEEAVTENGPSAAQPPDPKNATGLKRDVLAFGGPTMSTTEWLRQCLAETMSLRKAPQLLDEVSFEGVARYIADGKCSRIVTMAGAGISTSAGIPDYRSPGTGLFDMLKNKYNVKDAASLFNLDYFMKDPGPFFERSKLFFQVSLKPTPCHYFIRLLHEKRLLLRHYTQNIDTLERVAGLPEDKVVEAHGSYYTSRCMDCGAKYSFQWMKEQVLSDQIPRCEMAGCKGVVKPDIVLFGESLSQSFADHVEQDFPKCDLLIIMGTALAVQPFASLICKVNVSTPRLYINLDRGEYGGKDDIGAIFGGGMYFDHKENVTDVFKQARCDEACYALAHLLGWENELHSLVQREHKRVDLQEAAASKKKNHKPNVSSHKLSFSSHKPNVSSHKPVSTHKPHVSSHKPNVSRATNLISPATNQTNVSSHKPNVSSHKRNVSSHKPN